MTVPKYLVVGAYGQNTIHFITERIPKEMHSSVQRFQTENGRKFTAYLVQNLLSEYSIKFCPIRPRSPLLNGNAERVQRTVLTKFFATLDDTFQSLSQIDKPLPSCQPQYNCSPIVC